MKIRWLESGAQSLRRHVAYIREENPTAARQLCHHFYCAVLKLGEFPASGRIGQVAGTHEFVVSGKPYRVIYRVSTDALEIIRILHASMDWHVCVIES